jgi:DNA polymerase-3 subunit gamma/tau
VRYLRDLAVLQVAPKKPELVDASDEERAELVEEAGQIDRTRVMQMFDRMLRCCDELGKTLQPRLVLDCALIDVATIEPLVPLGDLIERLGDLESRVGRGSGPRPNGPLAPSGGGPRPAPRSTVPDRPSTKTSTKTMGVGAEASAPPSARAIEPSAQTSSGELRSPGATATAAPQPVVATQSAPTLQPGSLSSPVTMQPSGPVPKAENVASGSGPNDTPTIAVPATPQEALGGWAKVIDYLEQQRKISLRGYYEFARVLKWTAQDLELGFAADDDSRWAGENAAEQANINELRGVLAELGQKVKVTVRMLDQAESKGTQARSIIETTRETSSAERSKREQEAREHPITKHVLQAFGASIKEIKTDV